MKNNLGRVSNANGAKRLWGAWALALSAPFAGAGTDIAENVDAAAKKDFIILSGYHWHLKRAVDSAQRDIQWNVRWGEHSSVTERPLTLWFTNDAYGTRGCNYMSWTYPVDPSRWIKGKWQLMTMGLCDPDVMQFDMRVGKQLSLHFRYEVKSPEGGQPAHLQLSFADGSRWELEGEPTTETKYGGTGERIMIEIAAHHMPCSSSPNAEACLRVRQVQWGVSNGRGAFKDRGEWQPWRMDAVDGYAHTSGWHGVVHLDRFVVHSGPASATSFAYSYVGPMTTFSDEASTDSARTP